MNYKTQNRDNYDRSVKIKNIQILLYSQKMLNKQESDANIVGEVVLYQKKNQDKAENTVKLGNQVFTVAEPGKPIS